MIKSETNVKRDEDSLLKNLTDIKDNIKVIKNFIDNYSHKHPYFDVELVVYFSFNHQQDIQIKY